MTATRASEHESPQQAYAAGKIQVGDLVQTYTRAYGLTWGRVVEVIPGDPGASYDAVEVYCRMDERTHIWLVDELHAYRQGEWR